MSALSGFVSNNSSKEYIGISSNIVFITIRKLSDESNKEKLAKEHARRRQAQATQVIRKRLVTFVNSRPFTTSNNFLKKNREYTVGSFFKLKVVPCCLFLVLDVCVVHNYKVIIYTCSLDTIDLFKSPWSFRRLHVSRRKLSNIRILEIGVRQQC